MGIKTGKRLRQVIYSHFREAVLSSERIEEGCERPRRDTWSKSKPETPMLESLSTRHAESDAFN
jgi:hypothetical protein